MIAHKDRGWKMPPTALAVTLKDFTAMTGLGRTSAYELMRRGRLTKVRILGRTLITVASIHDLIANGTSDAVKGIVK